MIRLKYAILCFFMLSMASLNMTSCQADNQPTGEVLVMDDYADVTEFEMIFGVRKQMYTRSELDAGITQFFHCQEPFSLKLKDGKLNLSMTLYNVGGEEAGELKNNALVSGSDLFKLNYDATAIEVVNDYNIVAMRVELEKPNKIILSGAVKCDPEVIISDMDMTRQLPANNPENEATLQRLYGQGFLDFYQQEAVKISPVFIYDGNDYIGKRRNESRPAPQEPSGDENRTMQN